MKRLLLLAVMLLTLAGHATANDLATYKQTYDKQLEDIASSYGLGMLKLEQQYNQALNGLLIKAKRAGSLETTTAVMQETERFKKSKIMPELPAKLFDLQHIQSSYATQASRLEAEKCEKLIIMVSRYDKALERLQMQLVSTSALDQAHAVKSERTRVHDSPAVVSARQRLSESATRTAPPLAVANRRSVAVIPSGNLLKNPGNEAPCRVNALPGWESVAGSTWTQRTANPAPKEGDVYFCAGTAGKAELQQDVDVTPYRPAIMRGRQTFEFEGYVSSWETAKDTSRIVIEYLDRGKKTVLESYDSGTHRSAKKWEPIKHKQIAPRGTCCIRVRMIAQRHDGSNNDGYFDALALRAVQN
jgi:hypothetical protein